MSGTSTTASGPSVAATSSRGATSRRELITLNREGAAPEEVVSTNTYDVFGNLVQSVDRHGRVRVMDVDVLHRPYRETWYASVADAQAQQGATNVIDTYYDPAGRVELISDWFSTYDYMHDARDRLTTVDVSYPLSRSGCRSHAPENLVDLALDCLTTLRIQ